METQRLKHIIILILALLNLFLLVLLANFRWQQSAAEQRLTEQIYALYEANDLGLAEENKLSLDTTPPRSLSLQRNLEQEAAIAAWLLGENIQGQHQGGGIYTYTGTFGTVYFRSNGAFDYTPNGQTVDSPAEFCQSFCESFGYVITQRSLIGNSGSYTAERMVENTTVYNCGLSFLFEKGKLISLSGLYLSVSESLVVEGEQFTAADALVKFLDYRKLSGAICNTVTGVKSVYEYQSTAQSPSLAAKWQVSTDTYRYYVDCSTGAVTRA